MKNSGVLNKMAVWLAVALFLSIEAIALDCDVKYQPKIFDMPSAFKFKHGAQALTHWKIMFSVFKPTTSNTTCHLNCGYFLKNVVPAKDKLLYFKLVCLDKMRFVFDKANSTLWKSVVLYLVIDGPCVVSVKDLVAWGSSTDLIVMYLLKNAQLLDKNNTSEHELSSLSQLGTLVLQNTGRVPMLFTKRIWPKLAEIQFYSVTMQTFPREIVHTMPMLQSLEIIHSNLTTPPSFPWASSILYLPRNLSRTDSSNQHYEVNGEAIVNADIYRRFFILDYNKITNLSNFTFQGFLHKISLKGNGLKSVGSSCFYAVKGIQTIDLSENSLSQIPQYLFLGLHSLLRIHLEHNKIAFLHRNTFSGLRGLEHIYLQNNNLTTLGKGLMNSLNNLKIVHLENNKIESIENGAFPETSLKIEQIYLGNNRMKRFPAWLFLLRNIRSIDLSRNFITYAAFTKPFDSFELTLLLDKHRKTASTTDLQFRTDWDIKLNLGNNRIRELSLKKFNETKKTKLKVILKAFSIDLTNNPLSCDCDMLPTTTFLREDIGKEPVPIEISSEKFDTWKCVTPADLKGTTVMSVTKRQFRCERNLTNCPSACKCAVRTSDSAVLVDCVHRNLTRMPEVLPDGLLELHFQNNFIKDLLPYSYLKNVTALYLSGNCLSKLNVSSLHKMKRVKELLLDSNKLVSLPPQIQELNFTKIALRHNLFKCDCHARWMKYWLGNITSRVVNIEQVICNTGKVQGVPIIRVHASAFVCEKNNFFDNTSIYEDETFRTILYIVSSVLSVCICLLIVGFVYRVELKVFIFTRFNWHPFDRVDDSDPSKIYDAFVSYNSHDEGWVYETLRNNLESRAPPYRLCLHERDFVVGASIQENIFHSVQYSKRMIMVLSQHFIRSEWCMMEFRAAHHRVLQGRSRYLIIILMDDVRMSEVDDELKMYMRTNTYLSIGNKWFWEKLLYALPTQTLKRSDPNPRERPVSYSFRKRSAGVKEADTETTRC